MDLFSKMHSTVCNILCKNFHLALPAKFELSQIVVFHSEIMYRSGNTPECHSLIFYPKIAFPQFHVLKRN